MSSPDPTFEAQFPPPSIRPGAEVLIFDGRCGLCRKQLARLARWDRRGRFAYLSLHDPLVAARYPDLEHDDLMREMVLIDRQGRRLWGVSAFRAISRRIPLLWPFVPLLHFPGSLPLWRAIYRFIANRRYALGGVVCDTGACDVKGR